MYKAIATVNSAKKVIQKMDLDSLSDLRGTFKPPLEVEDLMATIIMIRKCLKNVLVVWGMPYFLLKKRKINIYRSN